MRDTLVGFLNHYENYTWFEFTDEYRADPHRPVLGLQFEQNIDGRYAANMRVPAWFSNLLPEGSLREWIADDADVSPDREMELLAHVGRDLPGAVRVRPAEAPGESVEGLADALRAEAQREPTVAAERGWRFSFAGVALKFSMLKSSDRFTCTASGEGGDWIVKVPDAVHRDLPQNEFTMMRFAASVGIDVPDLDLVHRDRMVNLPANAWRSNEKFAYAVRRFDRTAERRGIHIEDFAQVRGFGVDRKYEGNYETVANLIFRGHDTAALIEFVRRLTFCVLIGNGDAHLKNWSLIYRDERVPTLSPAYDLVCSELYHPGPKPGLLALRFAGSKDFRRVRAIQFATLARKLGTDVDLGEVAAETVRAVVAQWPEYADALTGAPEVRDAVAAGIAERSRTMLSGTA